MPQRGIFKVSGIEVSRGYHWETTMAMVDCVSILNHNSDFRYSKNCEYWE
jgi:hypothetical protein